MNINGTSVKDDHFIDIKLNVKDNRNIHDSLKEIYGHGEELKGEN